MSLMLASLQAWAWQKQRVTEMCTAATADRRDTVFLLQVRVGQNKQTPLD
jgi:hypothetical protein